MSVVRLNNLLDVNNSNIYEELFNFVQVKIKSILY